MCSLLLVSLICLTTISVLLYLQQSRELRSLARLQQELLREGKVPPRVRFRSWLVQQIWNKIVIARKRDLVSGERQDTYEELINLGKRLAGSVDQELEVASEVIRLIVRAAKPEVKVAAFIATRNYPSYSQGSTSNRLQDLVPETQVLAVEGVELARIEGALLNFVSYFGTREQEVEDWGYHSAEDHHACDFRGFGIGTSLAVPLVEGAQLVGIIFLGFGIRSGVLHQKRRLVIRALVEHASASYIAAIRTGRASRRSENERELLLSVSHDVRSPAARALYAVRDLLTDSKGEFTAEQLGLLGTIEESIGEQVELIGDMLDYVAFQVNAPTANKIEIPLETYLPAFLHSYKRQAIEKGISLRLDNLASAFVIADINHLRRMLSNLLSNAIKYTPSGEIVVGVESEKNAISIVVSDSGMGVPESEVPSLFKEFYRCSNGKSQEGTGLGLAIVRKLAIANDGRVWYRPRIQGGSSFGVTLKGNRDLVSKPEEKLLKGLKVLIVDDDCMNSRMTARFLQGQVGEIRTAGSVAEVNTILSEFKPGLVVSDFSLGDGTLLDFLPNIDPLVPLLVITGSAEFCHLSGLHQKERTCILEKPVDRQTLLVTLEKFVERLYTTAQSADDGLLYKSVNAMRNSV